MGRLIPPCDAADTHAWQETWYTCELGCTHDVLYCDCGETVDITLEPDPREGPRTARTRDAP
jgi:hypothetical protein